MVKSVILAAVNPGFEDLLFAELEEEPEVVEAHLSSHNNNIFLFVNAKDMPSCERLVRRLRLRREIHRVNNAYVVKEDKAGLGRLNGGRLALVFSRMNPGSEEAAMEGLKNLDSTRDVMALTGPHDLLVTAEVGGVYDLYKFELAVTKHVRFISGTESYLTMRSLVKD